MKSVAIDVGPDDADIDGGVWLLMTVAPAGSGQTSGAMPAGWQIKELGVSIAGEVVAAPRPITLDPPPRPFTAEQ